MLKLPKNSLFFLLHLPSFGPLVSIHGHETQFITNLCMWLPFQLCCVLLMELRSNAPTPDTSVIIYILSISKCMCQPQTALNLKPTYSTDSLGFTCSSQMHLKYPILHAQIQPPSASPASTNDSSSIHLKTKNISLSLLPGAYYTVSTSNVGLSFIIGPPEPEDYVK